MIKASATVSPQSKIGEDRIPAIIHLDLDGIAHIYRIHGWTYKAHDDPLFETGLRNALGFFDRAKVRATLFVIAENLDDPCKLSLLRDAVNLGHEVASHSLTHRKLTTLDRDEKRREIFESRERIAMELGVEVRGFRAPDFDMDRESIDLINEAGYAYDSSLFPDARCARKVGITKLSESPCYPFASCPLMELPLPLYTPLPLPFHPCYSLVLGTWYFRAGLRRFRRTGAPMVMLFHLTDFADALPDEQLHGWKTSFFTLSYMSSERKRQQCEQMLNLVRQEYNVVDTLSLLSKHSESPAAYLETGWQL